MIVFSVFQPVINTTPSSGGGKLSYNFFKYLNDNDVDVNIIFSRKGKLDSLEVYDLGIIHKVISKFISLMAKITPYYLIRYIQEIIFDLFLYFKLPKKIEILISYSVIPYTAKKLKKKGVKIYLISGNANDNLIYNIVSKEKLKFNITKKDPFDFLPRLKTYNAFIHNVDKVICINEYIYSSYDGYFDKKDRILIPTIFDANYKVFDIEKKETDDFVLFYCGHTSILKGLHNLIDSFNSFKINKKNVYLYIGGSINQGVQDIISKKDLSNIIFIGSMTSLEIANQLSKSTLFIVPSLTDAGPVTMVEAMYSKTPVICSDGVGNRWLIKDGHNGFVYEKDSITQLTEILNNIYSNKTIISEMGINAKKTIDETLINSNKFYSKLKNELL